MNIPSTYILYICKYTYIILTFSFFWSVFVYLIKCFTHYIMLIFLLIFKLLRIPLDTVMLHSDWTFNRHLICGSNNKPRCKISCVWRLTRYKSVCHSDFIISSPENKEVQKIFNIHIFVFKIYFYFKVGKAVFLSTLLHFME